MEGKGITYLADVNVLLAAVWGFLPQHEAAHRWISRNRWAYCALTEVGFIRVSLQPAFCHYVDATAVALGRILEELIQACHARHWTDRQPLHESSLLCRELTAGQITDVYLCELARQHGGKVATFDEALHRLHPQDSLLLPFV